MRAAYLGQMRVNMRYRRLALCPSASLALHWRAVMKTDTGLTLKPKESDLWPERAYLKVKLKPEREILWPNG